MDLNKKLELYRISKAEYETICGLLGREPQGLEWPLFSALWSEHCSYKTSRRHLAKFPSTSERVLQSFGENAGVIDLGQGEKVAFKMESHNHPSFIEPYQGAATGVGGILRDIFTMGARPIACANYLCFGEPEAERMPYLIDGVVRGIGGYGNCVGVPTITGQTEFHSSYNGNILVNAFALGLFREGDPIVTSAAKGPGNYVVYVGAKTGRDGVHGASMASESFDEDSESKKPTVQIGDPFFEKLLIESCLEVMKQNLVVSIQDMGAAGLTSSSFEMASKGNVGLRIHLDQVPIRDTSITPEEILLSESQERMLLICEPNKLKDLKEVFARWDLDAEVIGEVIEERKIELHWNKERVCSIDPHLLTENAPKYDREHRSWEPKHRVEDFYSLGTPVKDAGEELLNVLRSIHGTSREWVYRQYDQRVGAATHRDCSDSVAVLRLPHSGRGLGIVLGCRPYFMRYDAREGAKDAILYPSIELAAKGFEPLAVTDCLNFGNPEKPELMTELVASIEGMAQACTTTGLPVISGNVSLYNETQNENVTSTPSTGVVGLRENILNVPRSQFVSEGDRIALLRLPLATHSGQYSEYKTNQAMSGKGDISVEKASAWIKWLKELCSHEEIKSSRVVGKFGVPYALARMSTEQLGCQVDDVSFVLEDDPSFLFVEHSYEVIVTLGPNGWRWFKDQALKAGDRQQMFIFDLGQVVAGRFSIGSYLSLKPAQIQQAYHGGLEKQIEQLA